MPKESKTPTTAYATASAPYPTPTSTAPRNAGIWNSDDDETLLQARASGLNWQPIASRHFPNKTANACRKRHERLIERRHVEDWDTRKLELLADEYQNVRKEMWEMLASRVGERWQVVEQKCMEKGLKTLSATARTARRKSTATQSAPQSASFDDHQGIPDHLSDSGLGLGSDAEMEVDDGPGPAPQSASWHEHTGSHRLHHHQDHNRSRSLPQPLPLYRPPPPVLASSRRFDAPMTTSPAAMSFGGQGAYQRFSPDAQNGRGGISIQAVLSPV